MTIICQEKSGVESVENFSVNINLIIIIVHFTFGIYVQDCRFFLSKILLAVPTTA